MAIDMLYPDERRKNSRTTDHQYMCESLAKLLTYAEKVVMNKDGLHNIFQEECDSESLLDRAKAERFLMIELGYIVRLYFGDDYYDLYFNVKSLKEDSEAYSNLLWQLNAEIEQNAKLAGPVV